MMILTYRGTTTIPVEAECVSPDVLVGKSSAEAAALPVQHGNRAEPLGIRPGAGMKRGTIVFLGSVASLLPSFRYCCTYRPTFLALYLRQLRTWGFPIRDAWVNAPMRRYCGDPIELGKGEILMAEIG